MTGRFPPACTPKLYRELGLVNLLQLIPSMESYYRQKGYIH